MGVSSRAVKPGELLAELDDPVNPRFTMSLGRRGPLCSWKTQGVHKITDISSEDKAHVRTERHKTIYNITVETFYLTQYSDSAPEAIKVESL